MRNYTFWSFLQDHEGKWSSTRIKTFGLWLLTLAVIAYQVVNDQTDHILIGELLALSFGYEAFKKSQEIKDKEINHKINHGKDAKTDI